MSMQEDPFASVRINKPSQQPQPQQSAKQNNEADPFASARIKKAEGFPGLYETGRHATRIASRIAETVGGIPGDAQSLIQSGLFAGMEKLGVPASEDFKKYIKETSLPTTAELKEKSIKHSKGFTEPQDEAERAGDEIASTLSALVGPMKFRKALGAAVGGQIAKEGLKISGLGDTAQEAGKLGTMFMISAMNPGGALKYASSQYEKADAIAKGASVAANGFSSKLSALEKNLKKGFDTGSKTAVLKPTQQLLSKINNGKIGVSELTAAKRDISTVIKDPALLKRERKLLKLLGKHIDDAIKPFEQARPEFKKAYRPANEIYSAVMEGTKASDFIKRHIGTKSVIGAALGEVALGHPELVAPTAAAAAGVIGGAKAVDFATRIAKSKELQKYYLKGLSAAAAEDAAALRLYEDKLQEKLKD